MKTKLDAKVNKTLAKAKNSQTDDEQMMSKAVATN